MNSRARERRFRLNGNKSKLQLNRIYLRDKGICKLCKLPCKREDATRDHKIPFSKCLPGQSEHDSNIQLAHSWCNNDRGNDIEKLKPRKVIPELTQNIGALYPELQQIGANMGMDPNGILAFGYDLGGHEMSWKFTPDLENLPWYGEDENGDKDFGDLVESVLLAQIANFTEVWTQGAVDFWERKRAAEQTLGVKLISYGSSEYHGHILSIANHIHKSDDWSADIVRPGIPTPTELGYLDRAIQALEINPTQVNPEWILASFYG